MNLDGCYQLAYRSAYFAMRAYWRIAKPKRRGTLVAVWHNGKFVLIKNSYVKYFCLPGGYVRRREHPTQAAVRELREEISLDVAPSELKSWEDEAVTLPQGLSVFQVTLAKRPELRVDNREVVSAEFVTPEEALNRHLYGPLRQLLVQLARRCRATV